jgi:hypothetical protein
MARTDGFEARSSGVHRQSSERVHEPQDQAEVLLELAHSLASAFTKIGAAALKTACATIRKVAPVPALADFINGHDARVQPC